MGKEFFDASPEARHVFAEADRVLGMDLAKVIFEGPAEKLTSTAYCQPAILVMSTAALHAFQAHPKFKNLQPSFAAGLSLGEYSALAAAGALTMADTLKLVQRRAALMEEATKLHPGKMAAIIGMDKEKIAEVCRTTGAEVANFNSPQQIVITGYAAKVEAACEALKAAGAKSVIPLDVSGAFHSSLMQSAADRFRSELETFQISPPAFAVVSNVDGKPTVDPQHIRKNLSLQITSSVQWVDSVAYMASQGVLHFIEIGPGKVLSGLVRRIDPSLKFYNIEKPADIETLAI